MRWCLWSAAALLLLWGVYVVSPYWAFADLGEGLQTRNAERVGDRVNFRAVRLSLAKQIVAQGVGSRPASHVLGESDPSGAAAGLAVAAEPLLDQVVTPAGMVDLLGRLGQAEAGSVPARAGLTLSWKGLRNAARLALASRWRGFRNVYFPLPVGTAKPQARLQLRLSRFKWRLVAVELTPEGTRRLAEEVIKPILDRSRP